MEKDRNKEIELEYFVEQVVTEAGLDEPAPNFTEIVMAKVVPLAQKHSFGYEPLIPKTVWYFMAIALLGIFIYIFTGSAKMEVPFWPSEARSAQLQQAYIDIFADFSVSDTFLYGLIGLTLCIGIQVFLLKHHFEKRMVL